jgi:2-dehydro-3-deoxygluconokinase
VNAPRVLTIGAPIVAALPVEPVEIGAGVTMRWAVGGAELNVAVGLRRLGIEVEYVGRVGDDPLGAMVADRLRLEGIGDAGLVTDPHRATDMYVREWLPDGVRRLVYYRTGTAGAALEPADLPGWGEPPALVHLTGITAALGHSAAAAVDEVVRRSQAANVPVAFDPNHRPRLWSEDVARPVLLRLAASAELLLLSEEDAEVMFPGADDDEVIDSGHRLGCRIVVLTCGSRGAIASDGNTRVAVPAEPVRDAVDPVGAGDGFDAGFIAGHLRGLSLVDCGRLGARVGARAVSAPGEHDSYPMLDEVSDVLAEARRSP